jgi:glycosyltransferase involved in cell wall biosynthesis
VDFIFLDDPHYARGPDKRWEAHYAPPKPRWRIINYVPYAIRLLLGEARETWRLSRLMRPYRDQADVIHVNRVGCELQTIAAKLAGFKKVLTTIHNLPDDDPYARYWVRRLIERLSFNCGDFHIAVSEATRNAWMKRVGLESSKCARIYYGIVPEDLKQFDRTAYRRQLGIEADAFVAGICARLHRMKGHLILLQAFSKLLAERSSPPPAQCSSTPTLQHSITPLLLLAGEGPERANIEAKIQELNLGAHVRMLGHRSDAFRFIASLDVHVLPSIDLETVGLSTIEAMFAGVAPIVSDVGGIKELLAAAGGGQVVPARDVAALANALHHYFRHPEARRADGERLRQYAEEHLTAHKMANETLKIYEMMLKKEM